jgi:chromosomal replication initiation ATPase DnaA
MAGARVLAAGRIGAAVPQALAACPLALEDADRDLPAGGQAALFHLLNAFAAAGQWLLMTGRTAPARWEIGLPDLASRLAAMPVAHLAEPDDALLEAILARHLSARGLQARPDVLGYLTRRMERSAAAAAAIAARLDAAALAERSALTVPFARRVLGW